MTVGTWYPGRQALVGKAIAEDASTLMRQQRELFERLWLYRQIYRLRRRYDSEPVLSVAEAIAHGERLLRSDRAAVGLSQPQHA